MYNNITKNITLLVICYFINFITSYTNGFQGIESAKSDSERYTVDLKGCAVFERQCVQLDEDFDVLSCALNITHNNKTQVPFSCQHKIWTLQNKLLEKSYIEYKLKGPCQEETIISDCLNPSSNSLDCILKRKPILKNRICQRTIYQLESLIFNDWQITGNFLKNCLDDIEAHSCGRIPSDPKSLSQTFTLKCLQSLGDKLRPECQSEIVALKEMKYTTLQIDRLIFAACNIDQKNFCPDEVPDSLLMYKCLVRHKYENGKNFACLFFVLYCIQHIV